MYFQGDKGEKGEKGLRGFPGDAVCICFIFAANVSFPHKKINVLKFMRFLQGFTGMKGMKGLKGELGSPGPQVCGFLKCIFFQEMTTI